MSKKKKISNQNYMDFIVVKNPEIEYETNDKGQVTVMIEWRGFYHRIAQRFFKRPKVSWMTTAAFSGSQSMIRKPYISSHWICSHSFQKWKNHLPV